MESVSFVHFDEKDIELNEAEQANKTGLVSIDTRNVISIGHKM